MNELAGFCLEDMLWTKFIRGKDKEVCGECGGRFTSMVGYQITSQRTLTPKKKERIYERKEDRTEDPVRETGAGEEGQAETQTADGAEATDWQPLTEDRASETQGGNDADA